MTSATIPDDAGAASVEARIVNISCYKFVPLDNLEQRRDAIRDRAAALNLKGTVLLSPEGINLFVAGPPEAIAAFVDFLRSDPLLSDLQPKESVNTYQPFNRMLVKIKKEIIAFGIDTVVPHERTSPKLPAAELRKWLDEGRPVHLLDVRNDYEYDIGTFDNAIKLGLDHFREFPQAISDLPQDMRDQPVVMFCTGGIRCEKAGPFMEQAGFSNVFQLDGGILKYFEEVGGEHYHGECFVFDQRVAVNPSLDETPTTQCYICQAVVTPEQQHLPEYVAGKFCPACYLTDDERLAHRLQHRQSQLDALIDPLPGSQPYFNRRPLNVPERFAGFALLDFLSEWHPQVERAEWQRRIEDSLIVPGELHGRRKRRRKASPESLPLSVDRIVREGERFEHLLPGTVEPDVNARLLFLYEDDHIVVLNKPAPLPMHASGRFNRNTVRYLLNQVYHPERPHVVHRLDANTSGILVLCRKKWVARLIQQQFEKREVQKTYLARVHGHPTEDTFHCHAAISRDPGPGGVRVIAEDGDGDDAITDFEVLSRETDGTALLRVYPKTGRTNQIRAHLWYLGFPICGDPVYLTNQHTADNSALNVDDAPMCLHAESICVTTPDGISRTFNAVPPAWAASVVSLE